jgi:quercetin dioxygenase-like cupin family protein
MPQEEMEEEQIEMYAHEGEEFSYVLEGIITVYLDGARHTLYPGDSIQIRSNLPHNWVNLTNKTAKLLSVNIPNPLRAGE